MSLNNSDNDNNCIIDKNINKNIDKANILYYFRNRLSNLLGTVKLNYNFYPGTQQNLNIIIKKIEELILSLYNLDYINNQQNSIININNNDEENITNEKIDNNEKNIFELFYLFLKIETNSTFYELFLKFIQKFLKKLSKLDKTITKTHLLKFQNYYIILYKYLITKKFDYVGVQSDWSATFYISKCLSLLVYLFLEHRINHEKINPKELFLFLLETNNNLFKISISKNDSYITNDKFNKILISTFNTIIKDLSIYSNDITEIVEIILDKIISISKIKDDKLNKIDDYEESFHVDTLLLCLKLICKILKKKELCKLLSYHHKLKMVKGLIELSYWDNPNIVNYTCKILILIFKLAISLDNFSIRKELEKLIDFIFLRHFKQYFSFLEDKNNNIKQTDKVIKLSVLEILAMNFNKFIEFNDSLVILYFICDVYKIRFNIINEIFEAIHKYFSLNDPMYTYLKNSFTITYQIVFNKVYEFFDKNKTQTNNNNLILSKIEEYTDYWEKKLKLIKEGNLKELIKHFSKEYNLTLLKKNDKIDILSPEHKNTYQKLAKEIALIIRYSSYVDIENLFEIMAENNPFSSMILKEYSKTYDFKGYDIIKAMNLFMSTFKLMGESYNIYNFICAFATRYYEENKEIYEKNKLSKNKDMDSIYFDSEEEVTSFAYSIMILNTDLHNPNVINKMTVEEFIKNNRASGLFKEVPEEYFKKIYQDLYVSELKKANPRNDDYSKDIEIYLNLQSLESFTNSNPEFDFFINNSYFDILNDNNKINFELNKENFPFLNLFNKIMLPENKTNLQWLEYSYSNLFDELLPSVISLPDSFIENNTKLILNLFEKICDISIKLNRKEIIEKIIVCLNSLLTNCTNKNNMYNLFFKIVLKYNQDFHTHLEMFYKAILDLLYLNIKEDKNDTYGIYMEQIDNLINKAFNVISSKKKNKSEGVGFFNLLLFGDINDKKEFNLEEYKKGIYKKLKFDIKYKDNKKEKNIIRSNSTENLLVSRDKLKNNFIDNESDSEFSLSSNNLNLNSARTTSLEINNLELNSNSEISDETKSENEINIKPTKSNSIKQIKENIISKLQDLSNNDEDNLNKLIDAKIILNKIKIQEEEFIFFVTYATSKILQYSENDSDIYIGIIFLNEILKQIPEKQFGKIWPNIFNIFKSKMTFKSANEENIFEILFINFFLTHIIKDYFNNILNEDYNQILDTYEDIGSVELLLIILEINDEFIKSAINLKKNLSSQNIDNLIFLKYKLFLQLSKNISNLKDNYMLNTQNGILSINQINQVIYLFNNVLLTIKSNEILAPDCCSRISNIIKLLYDINVTKIFFELKQKVDNISELTSILSKICAEGMDVTSKLLQKDKQGNSLDENELKTVKEKNDFFNSIFIFLEQFCLKSALIEDEIIQQKFFSQISFFVSLPIPPTLVPKVINLVQDWHQYFSQLKIKYKNFWKDVINMFYCLFMNNPSIQNNSTDIEKLWTLLIKKYMISFNDENKNSEKTVYSENKEEIEIIKKIYIMVEGTVHKITNSQKLNWFESTKNMIKLYFPEVLVDSKKI